MFIFRGWLLTGIGAMGRRGRAPRPGVISDLLSVSMAGRVTPPDHGRQEIELLGLSRISKTGGNRRGCGRFRNRRSRANFFNGLLLVLDQVLEEALGLRDEGVEILFHFLDEGLVLRIFDGLDCGLRCRRRDGRFRSRDRLGLSFGRGKNRFRGACCCRSRRLFRGDGRCWGFAHRTWKLP